MAHNDLLEVDNDGGTISFRSASSIYAEPRSALVLRSYHVGGRGSLSSCSKIDVFDGIILIFQGFITVEAQIGAVSLCLL